MRPRPETHHRRRRAAGSSPTAFRRLCAAVALLSLGPAAFFISRYLSASTAAALQRAQPERAAAVVDVIRIAFDAYSSHAWGRDELRPLSDDGDDRFCGIGVTIVDSLSTLWLAGLREEFARGAEWAAQNASVEGKRGCSLFETNIRAVGGLLSAAQLSGDSRLTRAAARIAEHALPLFDEEADGGGGRRKLLPCNSFPVAAPGGGNCSRDEQVNLADVGTFTLEFETLSRETGDARFRAAARSALEALRGAAFQPVASTGEACPLGDGGGGGLLPERLSRLTLEGRCSASLGGLSDSYYEYLLKGSLMLGGSNGGDGDGDGGGGAGWGRGASADLRARWLRAVSGLERHLVRCTDNGMRYVGKVSNGRFQTVIEHLSCFAPGMLLLGGARRDLALELLDTCLRLYTMTVTGLGVEAAGAIGQRRVTECPRRPPRARPAAASAPPSADGPDLVVLREEWAQRPEVAESLFHAWRATGDPYYREMAWFLFTSLRKMCYARMGCLGAADAATGLGLVVDRQASFLLAETLKYYLLVFSAESLLPLDKWVLNTEAHPLLLAPRRAAAVVPAGEQQESKTGGGGGWWAAG